MKSHEAASRRTDEMNTEYDGTNGEGRAKNCAKMFAPGDIMLMGFDTITMNEGTYSARRTPSNLWSIARFDSGLNRQFGK